jgi:hypothetical protein
MKADDWVTLSLCAPANGSMTLWITAVPYYAGEFELSVTSNGMSDPNLITLFCPFSLLISRSIFYTSIIFLLPYMFLMIWSQVPLLLYPFATLNPGSGPYDLTGSSQLKFNDSTSPIYCLDPVEMCFGIYNILPSTDPDVAWPIPFIYLQLGSARFIDLGYLYLFIISCRINHKLSFRLNNYEYNPDPLKYIVGVILNYDVDGILGSFLSEDALPLAQLEFLGMVVNAEAEVFQFLYPLDSSMLSISIQKFMLSPLLLKLVNLACNWNVPNQPGHINAM